MGRGPANVQIVFVHHRRAMVLFFSEAFFLEVADRLARDAEWNKAAAKVTAKIILIATDVGRSILLDVLGVKMTVSSAKPEDPADFKFEAPIEQWNRLGKGEKDLQTLVLQGKIKFRGPLAKLVPLQPALFRVEVVARDIPKEF